MIRSGRTYVNRFNKRHPIGFVRGVWGYPTKKPLYEAYVQRLCLLLSQVKALIKTPNLILAREMGISATTVYLFSSRNAISSSISFFSIRSSSSSKVTPLPAFS